MALLFAAHGMPKQPDTVVMYGDSETQLNNWTAVLQNEMGPGYTVINTALAGQTSTWGLANLQSHVLAYHPDIVVFEFSMNDAVWLTLAQTAANTIAIIDQIRASDPAAKIYISTNNEPSAAAISSSIAAVPTSHLADIDAYYQQYRDIATAMGVGLIDNNPVWKAAQAADPSIVPDGYHPTLEADIQYQIPIVLEALGIPEHRYVTSAQFLP